MALRTSASSAMTLYKVQEVCLVPLAEAPDPFLTAVIVQLCLCLVNQSLALSCRLSWGTGLFRRRPLWSLISTNDSCSERPAAGRADQSLVLFFKAVVARR